MLLSALACAAAAGLALASPASASTAARPQGHSALSGTTAVTTAPGIAQALLSKGILPLPAPPAGFAVRYAGGLAVTYSFPVTGGHPSLSPLGGDIYHAGGINFASLTGKHLEIGKFDISLAAGTIYADQVNYAPGRIAVLDLGLSGLKVTHRGSATVLSGITLRLDPAAANALDATFGLSLPTDGSLVFGTAVVTLRG
jgi:hypothetical protein